MNVTEFRFKVKAGGKLIINKKEFKIKEVVRFRFDDGTFYFKCFLSEGYVFADDLNENIFILVKEVKTPFKIPFPDKINFQGKDFDFSYTARALAEEFWDYKSADGSYLSLGVIEKTKQRLDFYGKIVLGNSIRIEK